jgi:hypothetical protein
MATTTLLNNFPVSTTVTSPAVSVNSNIADAFYNFSVNSPNSPSAQFEFVFELSTDDGATWGIVGDHQFQNADSVQVHHGITYPIAQTYSVTAELPDYALGNKARLRVLTVTGGTWNVTCTMTN